MPDTGLQIDKLAHFVIYGILGLLLFRAIFSSGRLSAKSTAMFAILCAVALGALEEFYQGFSGRSPSVYDWLFDFMGATASSCVFALYIRFRRTQE
jgi:VanZ family protein